MKTLFTQPKATLSELQSAYSLALLDDINTVLGCAQLPSPLSDACRYAMANGGKRVRPLLVLASYLTVKADKIAAQTAIGMTRRAMVAIEMIHGYSLIHDDLPCMDDDMLRRGQPTCHVVYGEAVALLAGDALQSLAFELISRASVTDTADDWHYDALIAAKLSQVLAPRARRMVAGQMLDILGESATLSQDELENVHRDKTGALIEAAVLMGAICADADTQTLSKLTDYAYAVGLAFQVQDDVLDVVSDTATLGKTAGSDEKLDKSTYVTLMGVDAAKQYAAKLFADARMAVADFGENNLLLQLVDWLEQRDY